MEALKRSAATLLLAVALSACSSGDHDRTQADASATEPEPDPDPEPETDAAEPQPEATDDAGKPTSDPVPLTVWVDDLVDHHTTDDALPDTVDDKVITDDTDETSFDKYLPK